MAFSVLSNGTSECFLVAVGHMKPTSLQVKSNCWKLYYREYYREVMNFGRYLITNFLLEQQKLSTLV